MEHDVYEIGELDIQVLDGDRGKNYPRQNEFCQNGYCLFLSASNVTNEGFNFDSTSFITEEKDHILRGGKLQRNDVVITTRGTVGNVCYYDESIPYNNMRINSGMLIVRCGENILSKYVYYVLKSKAFQNQIKAIQTGSAQPQLPKSHFVKMKIRVPEIEEQERIVNVLSAIDKKINSNNAINKNLSDQLQTVYHDRFNPIVHTPTGILSDICKYSTDRIAVSELISATYYSTENMQPNKAGSLHASSLPSVAFTTRCQQGDVLVSNIRPYFKKIVLAPGESGCSADVLCFVPQERALYPYLFETLYSDYFFEHMVSGSKGTKMPRGDKQQIMKFPIVFPGEQTVFEFCEYALPMLSKIQLIQKENYCLSMIRNILLPRLMSGELDVSAIL